MTVVVKGTGGKTARNCLEVEGVVFVRSLRRRRMTLGAAEVLVCDSIVLTSRP